VYESDHSDGNETEKKIKIRLARWGQPDFYSGKESPAENGSYTPGRD
jgi:hypothetical protein